MKKHIVFLTCIFAICLTACSKPSDTNNNSSLATSNPTYCSITWEDYDGTLLCFDANVPYGSMPTYSRVAPTRANDRQYSYTFNGWTPEVVPAVEDATYVATYTSVLNKAKIYFDLDGGTTTYSTDPIYSSLDDSTGFFFKVNKENCNFRGWEYNGIKVFDQKGNKLSDVQLQEEMTFKAVYAQDVYLTIITNLEEAATISGEGTYAYNSYVDVNVKTNPGYTFLGWYDYSSGALLSNQETYKYVVKNKDITLEAMFRRSTYEVNVKTAHPLLGSVMIHGDYGYKNESTRTFAYLDDVTISAYTKTDEYRFLGWFDESGNLIEPSAVYTFTMPYNDYNLFARWDAPSLNVNISKSHENAGTVTGSGTYEYNSLVTIEVTTNGGYKFTGIYDEKGNKLNKNNSNPYSFNMPLEDVDLLIKWEPITYTISYDLVGGEISSSNPSSYTVEDSFVLNEPTKTGYTFTGWYDGQNDKVTSIQTGSTGNLTLTAKWNINTYNIALDSNGGEVSETLINVQYDHSYSLPSPTRIGYTFDGWYDGSTKVSDTGTWNYTSNKTFTAQWSIITYTITYELNGGEISSSNPSTYTVEDSFVLNEPTKTCYTFTGWYDEQNNKLASISVGDTGDLVLTATWAVTNYTIMYELNGGLNNPSNPSTYTIENDTITLRDPSRKGYNFSGWYNSPSFSNQVTTIDSGTTGDISLYAKWSIITYSITYDLNGGTISSLNPSTYTVEDSFTLNEPTYQFKTFNGWYLGEELITGISLGTIGDLIIEARWSQTDEQKAAEEKYEWSVAHCGIPTLSEDGKTITYGLYPQKNVNDSTLVSALNALTTPESNGWYLYNDEYYSKVIATPDYSSYTFDNGTAIVSGTTYWFKCEPITWNVLSNNNGEYYILSSVLLDAHCYYNSTSNRTIDGKTIYRNNYEYSDIRIWLNNDFYNSAFALGNEYIQTTTVDNSVSTTDSSSNSYACNNTQDKVFLPSYQDYINSNYGFSSSTGSTDTRYCKPTDWARARGACYCTSSLPYQYNGYYWTRSPSDDRSYNAWYVIDSGTLYTNTLVFVSTSDYCVRPAITIKIA